MPSLSLSINGRSVVATVAPPTLLVDFLRTNLGLTGTHQGCDTSQCGACTVLMDGHSVKSCSVLAVQAHGRQITTVEGLAAADGQLHPVQEAFVACHGLQCGFCTPGMLMTTVCLLQTTPQPNQAQIETALEGNLCRCTGYVNIVAAVQDAAQRLSKVAP
jgi:carbon-monoxide dehydrogenase small subunit